MAAVCSHWLAGWQATNEAPWPRRRLKQVPLDLPEEIEIDTCDQLSMAATPDGRLVVCSTPDADATQTEVRFLDRSMCVLQILRTRIGDLEDRCASPNQAIAADDDSIYHSFGEFNRAIRRSNHSGTIVAEYRVERGSFFYPVLAPTSGLLFCVMRDYDDWGPGHPMTHRPSYYPDDAPDEIIALDAQTLQLRHRFGSAGLLDEASQPAVVGDELYVCDISKDRLQVFSLTGEHRRSVTGAWRSPEQLCFAKGRLYLVEQEFGKGMDDDQFDHWIDSRMEDGELKSEDEVAEARSAYFSQKASDVRGHRVLVLSLQGEILRVVITHPTISTAVFTSICCFDGKLMAAFEEDKKGAGWPRKIRRSSTRYKNGVLALQGL